VPILTHTEEGRGGREQLALFAEYGISAERVVLSHTDKVADIGYHLDLVATGAYLEFDQPLRHPIGPGNPTVRIVTELVAAGYESQLMLATDGARRSLWTAYGGSPGLAALATQVVAVLREEGISTKSINAMLVANPARFFSFHEEAA
jgi:phosphotriesterase-related protein